jgi:hypothetical protein
MNNTCHLQMSNIQLLENEKSGVKLVRFDLTVLTVAEDKDGMRKTHGVMMKGCRAMLRRTNGKVYWEPPRVVSANKSLTMITVTAETYRLVLSELLKQKAMMKLLESQDTELAFLKKVSAEGVFAK